MSVQSDGLIVIGHLYKAPVWFNVASGTFETLAVVFAFGLPTASLK